MSEADQVVVEQVEDSQLDNSADEQQVVAHPEEDLAREQGWVPENEWQGDKSKWRPAKEFLDRGELFGKIDTMGRELKDTKRALKALQEHHTKVKEVEYKRAIDELRALQKQHLEAGNSDGYLETTELLTDMKAEQKAREVVQQNTPQNVPPDPRFTAWVKSNPWYGQNSDMRDFADTIGLKHAQAYPDKDPEEILKFVSAQIKRAYPDSFQNSNREKPNAVEGNSSTMGTKKATFSMSDEEVKVMNTFIRQGIMTKEAYIKELKSMRGAQ